MQETEETGRKFQSTLPQRERPGQTCQHGAGVFISIHAPAKGATTIHLRGVNILVISIHAPVKGATSMVYEYPPIFSISIHAPVKGAT